MVAQGGLLIDVRSPEEYAGGHPEQAINIPVDAVDAWGQEHRDARSRDVVVYCRSGRRSALAAKTLCGLGFQAVYDLGCVDDYPGEE